MTVQERPCTDLNLFCLLAGLVPDCTGSLASGLAGCLAFSASAFLYGVLQILCFQRLNMFHIKYPPVRPKYPV